MRAFLKQSGKRFALGGAEGPVLSKVEGFTLVELVITIGILAALATITALSLGDFREHQALSNTVDEMIAIVNQARSKTLAAEGGSGYGVHFDPNDAVLFVGPTYTPGDPGNVVDAIDPSIELDSVSLSGGGQEVLFDGLTGGTDDDGTVIVRRLSVNWTASVRALFAKRNER